MPTVGGGGGGAAWDLCAQAPRLKLAAAIASAAKTFTNITRISLLSWQVAQGDFGKTRPTDNNEAEKNQTCGSQSYSIVLRRFSLDPSLGTQATRALV
jgi:hypothetical protein